MANSEIVGATQKPRWQHDIWKNRKSDEWLTPPYILHELGQFDLDPAAPLDRPWDMASKHYTKSDDGFVLPWVGRVWLNPPYGRATAAWLSKLYEHGNGVALIFARLGSIWFYDMAWRKADAVFFFKRRLRFFLPDGTEGGWSFAPSCLLAFGDNNVSAIESSSLDGKLLKRVAQNNKETCHTAPNSAKQAGTLGG